MREIRGAEMTGTQIEKLKEYFDKRTDVAFSFLFGSQAKGCATKRSDVDVAVYFYAEVRHPVEYEADVYYYGEDAIWAELESLLSHEVDLVVLNRAPATVAASAIRGKPILIRDRGLYLDFMAAVTDEADSFMEFIVKDYHDALEQRG